MSQPDKVTPLHFRGWFNHFFGFCYGTGEGPIIETIQTFMSHLKDDPPRYDYRVLTFHLGVSTTWFLINALGNAGIIDYGCSPRFGWLSHEGRDLRTFMESKSKDELYEIATADHEDWSEHKLNNPLFPEHMRTKE